MSESKELAVINQTGEVAVHGAFANIGNFENAQRMAGALSKSDLVPTSYKNNIANCLVALEVAQRTGSSIMAVMQNLHVIHGRPSWSSSYVIAALNACGRFTPLRFEIKNLGRKKIDYDYWTGEKPNRQKKTSSVEVENLSCYAWCTDRASGERLEGPTITTEMAVKEGWYTKSDSKWQTMQDLMIRYRAGKFFGNLYAPDVLMGMSSEDEIRDVTPQSDDSSDQGKSTVEGINAKIAKTSKNKKPVIIDMKDAAVIDVKVNPDNTDSGLNNEPDPSAAEGEIF